MSARAETSPIRKSMGWAALVIVTVLALAVALFATLNEAIDDRRSPPTTTPAGWDAGKLEAMEGRQLAEAQRQALADAGAAPVVGGPTAAAEEWSMRELLEARQIAEVHRRELAATDPHP